MKVLRELVLDVAGFGGVAAFVYGVHQVFPPAAWMIGGLAVAAGAALLARSK